MRKGSASNTSSKTTYGNTTTVNPYFSSSTDSKGNTKTNFANGTAAKTTFDYVNKNIGGLLNNYLNPSLNNPTTQAKMDLFNKQQQTNLQNNIINPLASNNMIRSSQATNMYNNLSNQAGDYGKELIAGSQDDTWNMINNLMNLYTQGYTGAASEEQTSLNASSGNASTTGKGKAG